MEGVGFGSKLEMRVACGLGRWNHWGVIVEGVGFGSKLELRGAEERNADNAVDDITR